MLALGASVLCLVLAGQSFGGTPPPAQAPRAPSSSPTNPPLASHLQPAAHLHAGSSSIRTFSSEYYTQIGSTLSQINDTSSIAGLPTVSETITLVQSPYHTAYELNALSDTGDWYQIVVSVNWPGCAPGFEEGLEVWDSLGSSGPVICDSNVTLSLGDRVTLWLRFSGTSQACLGLRDLTTAKAHEICQAQPDVGGKKFIFLQSAANGQGYYTGTMTEIINQTTASCPDYTVMPTVTFSFPTWAHISAYVPWSDEWDLASGTLCFEYRGGVESVPSGDLTSHFVDTAAGTLYGPHWVEGQNDTPLNGSVGFRFQSDPTPITLETLSASTVTPYLGERVYLNATTSGGVTPYSSLWILNGSYALGWGSSSRIFMSLHPGNYTFTVYTLDRQGDVSLGASILIREPYPLWAGAVLSSRGGAADVGQVVNFSARVTGGVAWVSYAWVGLPLGCPGGNASWVRCVPLAPNSTVVDVRARDANGTTVTAPSLAFVVSPDPVIRATFQAIRDVGQTETFRANVTGGSGGISFSWHQLPLECAKNGAMATCPISAAGSWITNIGATDSNGFTVATPPLQIVNYAAQTVSLASQTQIVDVGQVLAATGTTAGGSGGTVFGWAGLPPGCVVPKAEVLVCRPSVAGNTSLTFSVSDRANATVVSNPLRIEVAPPLSIYLNASGTSLVAPAHVEMTLTQTGGSRVTAVNYHGVPPQCDYTSAGGLSCWGLPAGSYSTTITMEDVGGGNATTTAHFVVHAAPPPPPANAPDNGPLYELLAIILVAGAAIGLVAWAARKRRRGAPPRA